MVPAEGIEPPTFGLQNRCSTAELSRQLPASREVDAGYIIRTAGFGQMVFARNEVAWAPPPDRAKVADAMSLPTG